MPCRNIQISADLPEILIPEPSGGLSHISSLVEDMPFHGGEELTTAMMSAFIPVAMRSLLKVCLCHPAQPSLHCSCCPYALAAN